MERMGVWGGIQAERQHFRSNQFKQGQHER